MTSLSYTVFRLRQLRLWSSIYNYNFTQKKYKYSQSELELIIWAIEYFRLICLCEKVQCDDSCNAVERLMLLVIYADKASWHGYNMLAMPDRAGCSVGWYNEGTYRGYPWYNYNYV